MALAFSRCLINVDGEGPSVRAVCLHSVLALSIDGLGPGVLLQGHLTLDSLPVTLILLGAL